jgi:hypothetical protein
MDSSVIPSFLSAHTKMSSVDPALDPSMAFFRMPSDTSNSLFVPPASEGDRYDDDDDELPLRLSSPSGTGGSEDLIMQQQAPTFNPAFQEIGRLLKKRKHLTAESESDLDRFCAPVHIIGLLRKLE